MQENNVYYPTIGDEFDEELNINIKKLFLILWSRRIIIIKIFTLVVLFFILLTFIIAKKWTVKTDLYIKQSNSSNYSDINPYAIEESGNSGSVFAGTSPLANELELIQSPLVIDKVIQENDLRFQKLFGLFPTIKTGELLTTEKFLKRKIKFENKKGTNVVTISYTSKDKNESYNVVSSIIKNYIDLHKELNSEKSKSDKNIIESEYNKAKNDLTRKVNTTVGLPTNSMNNTSNLAAMSAFSNSAKKAMSVLKGQYIEGEKSRVEISEDAAKVSQLASKLEWARLVEEMSDSSKVIILKEPHQLRSWEYSSPKLFTNILLGIIMGIFFSIIAVTIAELKDKKLSFSMLDNEIIYDIENEFKKIKSMIYSNKNRKIGFVTFEQFDDTFIEKFKEFKNIQILKADISNSFMEAILNNDIFIMFASIGKTDSEDYKLVKQMIKDNNKKIITEVLV